MFLLHRTIISFLRSGMSKGLLNDALANKCLALDVSSWCAISLPYYIVGWSYQSFYGNIG